MMLYERLRQLVARDTLPLASGSRGIVGYSGGPDSLCLLHLLCRLASELHLDLLAVHIDHRLRPESSDEAREAVARARSIGAAVELVQLVTRPNRGNVQQWARNERLRAFRDVARARGAQWIALAHTANDQAETVLMRAVRGAGVHGLAAMERWQRLEPDLMLLRPLLDVQRPEISDYLSAHGLQAIEDPTNATDRYFRNRLRRDVLPRLQRENPAVIDSLCRLAQNCRDEDQALQHLAQERWQAARCADDALNVTELQQLPAGLLHRVLRLEVARIGAPTPGRLHLEALAELLHSRTRGTRRLSLSGLTAIRCYDQLRLVPRERKNKPALKGLAIEPVERETLARQQSHELALGDGRRLLLEWLEPIQGGGWDRGEHERGCGVSDGDRRLLLRSDLPLPLRIRGPLPGDRIAVSGGYRKVARVLIDAKVPVDERMSVPLVLSGDEVVLIVGVRRAHGWGPKGPDEAVWRVRMMEEHWAEEQRA